MLGILRKLKCWGRNEETKTGVMHGVERRHSRKESVSLTNYFQNGLLKNTIPLDHIAVEFHDRTFTFSQLSRFSSKMAEELISRIDYGNTLINNPNNDLIVAFCMPPSERLIPAIFAALKIGAAYMFLDTKYPEELIIGILKKVRPLLFITDESGAIFCKYDLEMINTLTKLISIEELWYSMDFEVFERSASLSSKRKKEIGEAVTPLEPPGQDFVQDETSPYYLMSIPHYLRVAVVVHVIDGPEAHEDPTGVRITHAGIMNQLLGLWEETPFTHKERRKESCLLTASLTSYESISQIFSPLLSGVTLRVFPSRDSKVIGIFIKKIGDRAISRLCLSVETLSDFLSTLNDFDRKSNIEHLKHLKHVTVTGQTLPRSLAESFFKTFTKVTLLFIYGRAELSGTALWEVYRNMGDVEQKSALGLLTLGRLMDNSQLYLLSPDEEKTKILKPGIRGQIAISGTGVCSGYVSRSPGHYRKLSRPEVGPNVFTSPDPEKYSKICQTGDYGTFIKCRDGRLRIYLEGRADTIIYQNNHHFDIQYVERTIRGIQGVKEHRVLVHDCGEHNQALVAYILPESGAMDRLTDGELYFQLRHKLPDYMIPEVKVVRELPKLDDGQTADAHRLKWLFFKERDPENENERIPTHSHFNYKTSESATVLFDALYKFCGVPHKRSANSLKSSIYELGASSFTALSILKYINECGYQIDLYDLIYGNNLVKFIHIMERKKGGHLPKFLDTVLKLDKDPTAFENYTLSLLDEKHKNEAFALVANAYFENGVLERFNRIHPGDYAKFLNKNWKGVFGGVDRSFIVIRKKDNKVVSVNLNCDFTTEFDLTGASNSMRANLSLRTYLHEKVKRTLSNPSPGQVFEIFRVATLKSLGSEETIKLISFMFSQIPTLAVSDKCKGVFLVSTGSLSWDLCSHVMGYSVLNDLPLRNSVPGEKEGEMSPFALACHSVNIATLYLNVASQDMTEFLEHFAKKMIGTPSEAKNLGLTSETQKERGSLDNNKN